MGGWKLIFSLQSRSTNTKIQKNNNNNKAALHSNGFQSLESNDVMVSYYDIYLAFLGTETIIFITKKTS